MLYLYDREEGQVINAGSPIRIERVKTKYGQLNQKQWWWILQYKSGHKKYYPCKKFEFHMMIDI